MWLIGISLTRDCVDGQGRLVAMAEIPHLVGHPARGAPIGRPPSLPTTTTELLVLRVVRTKVIRIPHEAGRHQ